MNRELASIYGVLKDICKEYVAAGLCRDCGHPRGDNGTTVRCRECADRANKYGKKRKKGKS